MNLKKYCFVAVIVVLGLWALLYRLRAVHGCGPFSDVAYFSYSLHPDLPLEPYAGGTLGVLQPTYARSYLYVAYRYMSGRSFDADEQKAVLALWRERLGSFSSGISQNNSARRSLPWLDQWIEARKKVGGAVPRPYLSSVYRKIDGSDYQFYFNCTDDGFRTAIATLNQQIAKFGADGKTVAEWLGAQDQVFSNCSSRPPMLQPGIEIPSRLEIIPASLQSGAPPDLRADRDYQIAAAYFYAANFDEASRRFQAIAQDTASPWRQTAALLIPRCLIRKATLNIQGENYDKTRLAQAEMQLKEILRDPKLREVQPSAERLVEFVELRLHPYESKRALASRLLREHVGENLKQNLWDYTVLMDKVEPDNRATDVKATLGKDGKSATKLNEWQQGDELSDWLLTFQDVTQRGLDHSFERWTQTHSLPWLVASLSKVKAAHGGVPELLRAAEKVEPSSPAYATVAFHRLRLRSEAGHSEDVRTRLDKLLSEDRRVLPPSSLNLFLALRMKVANNQEEFLRFAQRVPASVAMDQESTELPDFVDVAEVATQPKAEPVLFDADSTEILNKMLPLNILAEAAESKTLSDDLRRQVAQATWVRAVLLGDSAVAERMTPVWESLDTAAKNDLEAYRTEKSPESARFAAIYLMLKFPGTRPIVEPGVGRGTEFNQIDHFRDNWWCLPEPNPSKASPGESTEVIPMSGPLRSIYPDLEPLPPAFLSHEQKSMADGNWDKLPRVAPNYFAREVLAWGKQHPDDPREAEALYLVVRATRYGCTDVATAGLSKTAFEFLHAQYPKTEWARKTKYWYGQNSNAR